MAEVRAAVTAHDFSAMHAVARIILRGDVLLVDGFVETGPAGTGIKFCIRIEQLVAACGTFVHAGLFALVVLACEGAFRAFQSANLILLGCQFLLPLFFRFFDFRFHEAIVLQSMTRRLPVRCGHSPKGGRTFPESPLNSVVQEGFDGRGSMATEDA